MTRRLLVVTATVATALAAALPATAARPLYTGINEWPTAAFEWPGAGYGFPRVKNAGATFVKIHLVWSAVAPSPPTGNRADPAAYGNNGSSWAVFDQKVRDAYATGLVPLFAINTAPPWASPTGVSTNPNPYELALFAHAAAMRYSGRYTDPLSPTGSALPAVHYWQAWNEPNLSTQLTPQFENGRAVSPGNYRTLVNLFRDAVKTANPSSFVIAGGTNAFNRPIYPLAFMREFLCLNRYLRPISGCGPVRFDIWAHHPFTEGGPTHQGVHRDAVSLGDLPDMRRTLNAAIRAGKIGSNGAVRFWVDEFGWDTNGPDPSGVPMRLHVRWTAEALYRMWSAGITLVTWEQLSDNPCGQRYQAGLYFRSSGGVQYDAPKPSLGAFRFPFVAFDRSGRLFVWGRVPPRANGTWASGETIGIERRTSSGWRRIKTLYTNSAGIFSARWASSLTSGYVRARFARGTSYGFSLTPPRDRRVTPFPTTC